MLGDLLTPLLLLALVLIPIYFAEKWIQSHLYGVGWLLTGDNESATFLYYLFLFPGVLLHEVIQWLLGYALGVQFKEVRAWPQAQENGTLRYDFVKIEKANAIQAAILGAAPLVAGIVLVWYISNRILNLEDFLTALGSADITIIGPALRDLGSTPDFYLWLYLMFAIANAMLPTPADRKGWPVLFGLFVVIIVVLIAFGVGDQLYQTYTGPVAHALDLLTTAFGTVLVVEVWAMLVIGFTEEILEKVTNRKFQYSPPRAALEPRQPGSDLPLPPHLPLPSIYNLPLPVPDPSEYPALRALAAPSEEEEIEEAAPTAARPAARPVLGAARTEPAAEEPLPLFRRPAPQEAEPGDQASPARRPFSRPAAVPATEEPAEEEKPSPFRRPLAPAARDTGMTPEKEAEKPSPFRRPFGPAAEDAEKPDEERPSPLRRAPGAPERPAFRSPGTDEEKPSPFRRPFGPAAEDAEKPDEERPSPLRRAPGAPERPAFRSPGTDEEKPSPFRRPFGSAAEEPAKPSPFRSRFEPSPLRRTVPSSDDDADADEDEDEDEDEVTYEDFDDI